MRKGFNFMKNYFAILLISLGLVAVGCSTIYVNQDYDKNTNFADLKTYDWLPTSETGESAKARMKYSTLWDKRVHDNVDRQLTARGYQQNSTSPDFYVMYYIGSQEKIDVTDWGYHYGRYGYYGSHGHGWYGGRGYDVQTYTEGTVILDIIEAKEKQLIWRGYASSIMDEDSPPEAKEKRFNQAIARMLAKFPPKGNH
jgi:hypothetical protein